MYDRKRIAVNKLRIIFLKELKIEQLGIVNKRIFTRNKNHFIRSDHFDELTKYDLKGKIRILVGTSNEKLCFSQRLILPVLATNFTRGQSAQSFSFTHPHGRIYSNYPHHRHARTPQRRNSSAPSRAAPRARCPHRCLSLYPLLPRVFRCLHPLPPLGTAPIFSMGQTTTAPPPKPIPQSRSQQLPTLPLSLPLAPWPKTPRHQYPNYPTRLHPTLLCRPLPPKPHPRQPCL